MYSWAPYGILLLLKVNPVFGSTIFISAVLEITISTSSPLVFFPLTVFKSSISIFPSNLAVTLLSSEILPAIPPTWKVLNVS